MVEADSARLLLDEARAMEGGLGEVEAPAEDNEGEAPG